MAAAGPRLADRICENPVQQRSDCSEIGIHRAGAKAWAAPPSRPWLKGAELILDDAGKLKWQPLLEFMNHGTRASWSRQCVAVVKAEHPELFLNERQIQEAPVA
jgi:hypothetical protein